MGHGDRAEEIRVEGFPYDIKRSSTWRCVALSDDTRIVDEDIEPAVVGFDLLGGSHYARRVTNIDLDEGDGKTLHSQLFGRTLASRHIPRAQQNLEAGLSELACDFQSDTLVCTCHQRNAVVCISHSNFLEISGYMINLKIRTILQVLNSHMTTALPTTYNARKAPRQARSTQTVEAIYEATIQVLLTDGTTRLTTTSVAQRAGVSVGTLYQYFPNKQSLFFAVNERYLDMLAERVEAACGRHHGKRYAEMAEALVGTYIKVKTERRDMTRVLYLAAGEINVAELVEMMTQRVEAASEAMFATASDGPIENLSTVNLTILNVLFGTVRSFFDRNMSDLLELEIANQIISMFCAYLSAATSQRV